MDIFYSDTMKPSVYSLIFRDYSFKRCIEKLSEIGYNVIEIRVSEDGIHLPIDASEEQINSYKKILNEYGFEVSCLAGYKKLGYTWDKAENEIKSMIKIGEMADKFGAPVFRIKVAKYDLSIGYERIRMLFRSQAVKLIEELRSRRINSIPVVEQHGGGDMAHSTGILIDLFRGLDPDRIGIMFDPGNAVKVGWLPIELQIDMIHKYIKHVHVKNYEWDPNRPGERIPSPLHRGIVDWVKIISMLKKIGFKGYLSLEDFRKISPEERAREALEFFKKYL